MATVSRSPKVRTGKAVKDPPELAVVTTVQHGDDGQHGAWRQRVASQSMGRRPVSCPVRRLMASRAYITLLTDGDAAMSHEDGYAEHGPQQWVARCGRASQAREHEMYAGSGLWLRTERVSGKLSTVAQHAVAGRRRDAGVNLRATLSSELRPCLSLFHRIYLMHRAKQNRLQRQHKYTTDVRHPERTTTTERRACEGRHCWRDRRETATATRMSTPQRQRSQT
jgi:hypothetical protein